MPPPRCPPIRAGIQGYFRSGWGFLVPYVGCYALYGWFGWPVTGRPVPLLLVFGLLHLLHVTLAFIGFAQHIRVRGWAHTARAMAPWIALGLFLLLPGAYLEYPSDAWEHLRRIQAWEHVATAGAHPEPAKMAYFFIYSLLAWIPAEFHSWGLAAYIMGAGIALSWIFYRLGRSLGFSRNIALLATLLQALLAGNNTFSFLRYYGLSSTPWAHLAAFAIVGVVVRALRNRSWTVKTGLLNLVAVGMLLAVILLNHKQAFAIAGLATICAVAGRIAMLGRTGIVALVGVALASGVVASYLVPENIVQPFVRIGWLNSWSGINLLDPSSPAFERALQLLGGLGAINVCVGFLLIRRRPMLAALTIGPVLLLLHPVAGWLLATTLTATSAVGIAIYHRLFMAIPAGFALAGFAAWVLRPRCRTALARSDAGVTVGVLLVAVLVTVPASGPWFNRFWHATMRVPSDLTFGKLTEDLRAHVRSPAHDPGIFVVGPAAAVFVFETLQPHRSPFMPVYEYRLYQYPHSRAPDGDLAVTEAYLNNPNVSELVLLQPRPTAFFTPASTAALLSRHWNASETVLSAVGSSEMSRYHSPTKQVGVNSELPWVWPLVRKDRPPQP
jgi:hypothetical protein